MARPQQRELARNEKVPALSPDATETQLTGEPEPDESGRTGAVPEENLPGHHPEEEQDKPEGEAFLRKLQGEDRPRKKAAGKKKSAAKRAPTAKKVSAPVKKAAPEPEPAPIPAELSSLPSGQAETVRVPDPVATTQASTTIRPSGGLDVRDVAEVGVKLVFWPVTVGRWAGRQVLRRLQSR
jgi:hypothetical protein